MTTPLRTSRDAKKAETRVRLKDAALAAFAAQGFAEASIADITKAAGVAQGTFYVHFDSKEAVLAELLEDFNVGLVQAFAGQAPQLVGDGDLRATVEAMAETFLDYWRAQRPFVSVFAQRAAAGLQLDELRDGVNPALHRFLVEMLVARTPRGTDRATLGLVAHGVLALWLRLGMQWLFADDMTPARRRAFPALLADLTVGMLDPLMTPRARQGGRR